MSSDLIELKQEVIETRTQVIKTDNQIRNMALDLKGFERRFESLEKRTRATTIATHVVVALTAAIAMYLVGEVRIASNKKEIAGLHKAMEANELKVAEQKEKLNHQLAGIKSKKEQRKKSEAAAIKIVDFLDRDRDQAAARLVGDVDLEDLTALERQMIGRRITDLKRRTADEAYRAGRALSAQGKLESAAKEYRRVLHYDAKGPLAPKARYMLGSALFQLKNYEEAEPVLRALQKESTDKNLLEEIRFLLGLTLARNGKTEDAKPFLKAASIRGRYQATARKILKAVEAGEDLP